MSDRHAVENESSAGRKAGFQIEVAEAGFDFQQVALEDPVPTGRQIAEVAGFRPAEEHLVFQHLADGALEELRLDETTELRRPGCERFIVFRSERSFRLEIDERRFEWGACEITGRDVKLIARADPACTGVWLERQDEPDLFVGNDDAVPLAEEGLERFRTALVFILFIEGKEFTWEEQTITAEQIVELGGWDLSQGVQEINLETNEARTLKPGEVVELTELKNFAKKIGWRRG